MNRKILFSQQEQDTQSDHVYHDIYNHDIEESLSIGLGRSGFECWLCH